jgi:hypothetical protein
MDHEQYCNIVEKIRRIATKNIKYIALIRVVVSNYVFLMTDVDTDLKQMILVWDGFKTVEFRGGV